MEADVLKFEGMTVVLAKSQLQPDSMKVQRAFRVVLDMEKLQDLSVKNGDEAVFDQLGKDFVTVVRRALAPSSKS